MSEYKPALTEVENQRINELMEKLKKIHYAEKEVATELRKLIYKVEKLR
jgi:hypothetical protein